MRTQNEPDDVKVNSRAIQGDLDFFENSLKELKISYEQYFSALLPLPPTKDHDDIRRMIRTLLRTPFKNSQANFRMKNLILRYHTLNTHWERVLREKEEGTYSRDRFRAKMRSDEQNSARRKASKEGQIDSKYKELFDSYKSALDSQGLVLNHLEFNKFKQDLEQKATMLSDKSGGKKVKFAIEVGEGKVSIKARV